MSGASDASVTPSSGSSAATPATPDDDAPARTIEDRPAPTDSAGEFVNAVDLVAGLVTGEVRPRDVARTFLEKVFGPKLASSTPTASAPTAPSAPAKLTAIDGGAK